MNLVNVRRLYPRSIAAIEAFLAVVEEELAPADARIIREAMLPLVEAVAGEVETVTRERVSGSFAGVGTLLDLAVKASAPK